jgi:hypothetical protein
MTERLIELEVADGVATLWLNRPEKRNAMSDDMRTQFIAALEQVASDKAIRALVLTGRGKGFCAGGDVAGMERQARLASTGGAASNVCTTPSRSCTPCPSQRSLPSMGLLPGWVPTQRLRATSSSQRMRRASPGHTSIAASFPMAVACTFCRAG